MALSAQDILHGVDFTGVNPVTGADLNNGVDLSAPVLDTATEGKGLVIWTIDSALDTPVVPNAVAITKWKRYIWLRIPHSTATSLVPLFYAWNDDAVNDATYLKWKRIEADFTAIEADITAIEADIATVEGVAANAATVAGIANTNASAAVVTANAASATAATANANATQAITDAAAAQADADTAGTTANTALTNANAAQVTATNALNNSLPVAANKFYTRSGLTILDGVIDDNPHGLGATPKFVRAVLVCGVAEDGYAIGDEVDIHSFDNPDNNVTPFSVMANVTNVAVICSYIARISVPSKATPSAPVDIIPGNWTVKVYAWL